MGGATFPSAMKLELGRKSAIDTLILNGGECEPYLSCDDRLMRERASGVVDGARLILHATGADRALDRDRGQQAPGDRSDARSRAGL